MDIKREDRFNWNFTNNKNSWLVRQDGDVAVVECRASNVVLGVMEIPGSNSKVGIDNAVKYILFFACDSKVVDKSNIRHYVHEICNMEINETISCSERGQER